MTFRQTQVLFWKSTSQALTQSSSSCSSLVAKGKQRSKWIWAAGFCIKKHVYIIYIYIDRCDVVTCEFLLFSSCNIRVFLNRIIWKYWPTGFINHTSKFHVYRPSWYLAQIHQAASRSEWPTLGFWPKQGAVLPNNPVSGVRCTSFMIKGLQLVLLNNGHPHSSTNYRHVF